MKTINKTNQNNLKEIPFVVPKGYFDSFESRLEKRMRTESEENRKLLRGKIIKFIKPVIGIAAGLIFVLLITNVLFKDASTWVATEQSASFVEVQYEEELLANINIADLDEETFYEVLTSKDDSLVSVNSSETIITILTEELSDYDLCAEIIN